jgi:pimeloyl-ACP methyl ester carboxylesterase
LADSLQVIGYELRGERDCFSLRRGFGLDDLVDDLCELIDRQGLEQPILMGVSFGGMVALKFAARYPGRLAGLVVQGVDVRFRRSLLRQIAGQVLSRYPLPANNPFVNQFFNLLFGGRQRDRLLVDFVTRQSWQTDQSVMAHRFRLVEQVDLADDLRHIRVPTLILSGEKDVLVSPEGPAELTAGIRQASLIRLPRAGHLAFTTHPGVIAKHVFEFAKKFGLVEQTANSGADAR